MSTDPAPYLVRLGERVARGLARLEPERRERHRRFIFSQQMPDGGFRGREGDSDLYYTSFAVRTLGVLGGMTAEEATRVGQFLGRHDFTKLSIIDLINWLYSGLAVQSFGGPDVLADAPEDWSDRVADILEAVRTQDGGYAKSVQGARGSTYHSFLTVLTYQLLGRDVPRPQELVQFLYDRQRDDGGFVEIDPMKRSGTNPTAAAAAVLALLGAMDDELRADIGDFLREVRSGEGGFQANTRVPFADGLSTFTGLLTVQDLNLNGLVEPEHVQRFITDWLEFPTGGCRGASWDEQADVEYTFYGLGCLGLLWSAEAD